MGKRMCKSAWVLPCICLVLGRADRTPLEQDSANSGQEDAAAKSATGRDEKGAEILNRAIAAFGGDSAQMKLRSCKMTTRCVVAIPAAARDMGGDTVLIEDCFCYPDQWRRTVRRGSDGVQCMSFVLNGNRHWALFPGKKVQEMPLPRSGLRKPAVLATLDNLKGLRESKEEIVIGPDEGSTGQILIPLTVVANGHRQTTTYFEQATGLIAKEVKYYMPGLHAPPDTATKSGPVETETTYGDYKNFEGVTLPTHMVMSQAGKTVLDVSVLQVEFPAKFDANMFQKPQD